MADETKKFRDIVASFDRDYPDTDLIAYFGPIRRPYDDDFIELFEKRSKLKKNLVFALSTLGGDPDAAYRIARCIQLKYGLLPEPKKGEPRGKVSIYVDSICASAGTLIALCADELILSEYAELSPLDIQVRKPDDVWERDSGLTPTQALDLLERRSKSLFKEHFNQLRLDSEMGLTTRTAVEVASKITTGLLSEIYGQLDPMRLGEFERLMGITAAYGERLQKSNVQSGALARLLMGYPSHSFVIDRCEASELFKAVAVPKTSLFELGKWYRSASKRQMGDRKPVMFFLTEPPQVPTASEIEVKAGNEGHVEGTEASDGAAAPRAPSRRRAPRRRGETAVQ